MISIWKRLSESLAKKRAREIERMKREAVNVIEFDGEVCIAVNGKPLLPISRVGIPFDRIRDVLKIGRETWIKYHTDDIEPVG